MCLGPDCRLPPQLYRDRPRPPTSSQLRQSVSDFSYRPESLSRIEQEPQRTSLPRCSLSDKAAHFPSVLSRFQTLASSTRAAPTMRVIDATYPENDSGPASTPCDDDPTSKRSSRPRAVARGEELDGAVYHKRRKGNPGLGTQLRYTFPYSDEGITTTACNRKRPSRSETKCGMRSLMCLSLVLQPAAAVLLNKFDNCLPDSTKYSDPLELQWVPLHVGAIFDIKNKSHNLRITVWGNVTGTYNPTAAPELPPWTSDDWSNPNVTAGKIVDNPFPTTANFLTTLHSKIDVVTYEPYSADFDFCKTALTNASCPLAPVFNTTEMCVAAVVPVPYQGSPGVRDVGRCGDDGRCSPLCGHGGTAGSCSGLGRLRSRASRYLLVGILAIRCPRPDMRAR